MSTIQTKRKQPKVDDAYFNGYIIGKTVEEVYAQEAAAHDRYVMKLAKEMSRPKTGVKPPKTPK